MTTVIDQLRAALGQATEGHWTKGGSTHNAVALTPGQRIGDLKPWDRATLGYRIADFHHGSDNWSVCWLMAHAKDLVRLAEILSDGGSFKVASADNLEDLRNIYFRLNKPVADPEAWPR